MNLSDSKLVSTPTGRPTKSKYGVPYRLSNGKENPEWKRRRYAANSEHIKTLNRKNNLRWRRARGMKPRPANWGDKYGVPSRLPDGRRNQEYNRRAYEFYCYNNPLKACKGCGKLFRPRTMGETGWQKTRYCSIKCYATSPEGERDRLRNKKLGKGIYGLSRKQLSVNGQKASVVNKRTGQIYRWMTSIKPSPTDLEQRVFGIIKYHSLPYQFVGDTRRTPIGGKFPDFISNDGKTIVEVAMKSEKEWRRKMSWGEWENRRKAHFENLGYKCIVLWSDMADDQMVKLLKPSS